MKFKSRDGTSETNSHWDQVKGKPTIAIDLHHTITTRCAACEGEKIWDFVMGEPQKGVNKALNKLRSRGFRILIFTGSGEFWDAQNCSRIIEWLDYNYIPYDEIRFNKPAVAFIVDDRAIHHKSWEKTLKEIEERSIWMNENDDL